MLDKEMVFSRHQLAAHLDVLLVQLSVVGDEVDRLLPGTRTVIHIEVITVTPLHPVLHPLAAVVACRQTQTATVVLIQSYSNLCQFQVSVRTGFFKCV